MGKMEPHSIAVLLIWVGIIAVAIVLTQIIVMLVERGVRIFT